MQQQRKLQESRRYEMTNLHEKPSWRNVITESKVTTSPKPKPKHGSGENNGREKIVEISHLDMNYDGGVYEVIANDKDKQWEAQKPSAGDHRDTVYDSLNVISQTSQLQIDLFRRMMYLMTLLLVIVFLTTAASLALTAIITMSEKTFSQPTPAPGKLSGGEQTS